MKRIRIMAAVLAIAMAAAASSGCGADSKDGGDRTTAQPAKQQEPSEETTTGSAQDAEQDEGKDDSAKASGETYRKIPDPVVKDGDKILFVGNSHTYTNDLPGMFFEMAQAGGHGVDVYDLTEGSYTLQRFSDPEDELGEILTDALQSEPWDFCGPSGEHQCGCCFQCKKGYVPLCAETGRDDQGRRRPDRISHDLGTGGRRRCLFQGNGAGTAGSRIQDHCRGAGRAADPRRGSICQSLGAKMRNVQLWGRMVSILPWRGRIWQHVRPMLCYPGRRLWEIHIWPIWIRTRLRNFRAWHRHLYWIRIRSEPDEDQSRIRSGSYQSRIRLQKVLTIPLGDVSS